MRKSFKDVIFALSTPSNAFADYYHWNLDSRYRRRAANPLTIELYAKPFREIHPFRTPLLEINDFKIFTVINTGLFPLEFKRRYHAYTNQLENLYQTVPLFYTLFIFGSVQRIDPACVIIEEESPWLTRSMIDRQPLPLALLINRRRVLNANEG